MTLSGIYTEKLQAQSARGRFLVRLIITEFLYMRVWIWLIEQLYQLSENFIAYQSSLQAHFGNAVVSSGECRKV